MIKKLALACSLFLLSLGVLQGVFNIGTQFPVAEAAPAECYGVTTTSNPWVVTIADCETNPIFIGLESTISGGYKDDHCYIWGGLGLVELPLTNDYCVNARTGGETPGESSDADGDEGTGGGGGPSDPSANGALNTGFNTPPSGGGGATCGGGPEVTLSVDIGCNGEGNPIVDMTFAFTRFLSIGVGLVAVASIIVGGIQYTTSGGSPEKTAKAIERISNTVIALLIYFLIFAILNWVVPGGVF